MRPPRRSELRTNKLNTALLDRSRPWRWPLLVALVGALALRIFIFSSPTLGSVDSDQAVTGLMALRLIKHLEFPVFYWGQFHGGTLAILPIAAAFSIFGPSGWALRLIPTLLSLSAAILIWRIGRRTVGERPGALAGLIFLIWPAFFVWMSTQERGFYWVCLNLGLISILLVLRLIKRPTMRETFGLGVVAGLGFWTSPQFLYLIIPAAIWLVARQPKALRAVHYAAGGAMLGALPWIIVNVRESFPSRWQALQPEQNFYLAHLLGFFRRAFPMAYGIKVPFADQLMAPIITIPVSLALLGGFLWIVIRRPAGSGLLLLVAGLYPFMFASMPPGWTPEPRYVLFLSPVVALVVGWAIYCLSPKPFALSIWLVGLTGLSALALVELRPTAPIEQMATDVPAPPDTWELIQALDRHNIEHIFADYWVAYRVVFETEEKVISTPIAGAMRNAGYQEEVRGSDRPAYVFPKASGLGPALERTLDDSSIGFRRIPAGDYVIYLPHSKVLPEQAWGES